MYRRLLPKPTRALPSPSQRTFLCVFAFVFDSSSSPPPGLRLDGRGGTACTLGLESVLALAEGPFGLPSSTGRGILVSPALRLARDLRDVLVSTLDFASTLDMGGGETYEVMKVLRGPPTNFVIGWR